jgi:hypothetical protein
MRVRVAITESASTIQAVDNHHVFYAVNNTNTIIRENRYLPNNVLCCRGDGLS